MISYFFLHLLYYTELSWAVLCPYQFSCIHWFPPSEVEPHSFLSVIIITIIDLPCSVFTLYFRISLSLSLHCPFPYSLYVITSQHGICATVAWINKEPCPSSHVLLPTKAAINHLTQRGYRTTRGVSSPLSASLYTLFWHCSTPLYSTVNKCLSGFPPISHWPHPIWTQILCPLWCRLLGLLGIEYTLLTIYDPPQNHNTLKVLIK